MNSVLKCESETVMEQSFHYFAKLRISMKLIYIIATKHQSAVVCVINTCDNTVQCSVVND